MLEFSFSEMVDFVRKLEQVIEPTLISEEELDEKSDSWEFREGKYSSYLSSLKAFGLSQTYAGQPQQEPVRTLPKVEIQKPRTRKTEEVSRPFPTVKKVVIDSTPPAQEKPTISMRESPIPIVKSVVPEPKQSVQKESTVPTVKKPVLEARTSSAPIPKNIPKVVLAPSRKEPEYRKSIQQEQRKEARTVYAGEGTIELSGPGIAKRNYDNFGGLGVMEKTVVSGKHEEESVLDSWKISKGGRARKSVMSEKSLEDVLGIKSQRKDRLKYLDEISLENKVNMLVEAEQLISKKRKK